jgi:[ribosomal protein S5]-alanine N-acetyltransferase
VIPLPDPPLRSGQLLLRPWRLEDAPALVAAWADEEIQRWTAVPERRDLAAAERWIAGEEIRRARWLSLDLVVDRAGVIAGEVGLTTFDRVAGTAEIGWWTTADHRGRGVATAAATLLIRWARSQLGLQEIVARCEAENPAAVAVARQAGAMVLL